MAGDPKPHRPADEEGAGAGWTFLSYLISGMLVWGLIGWAVDAWLDLDGIGIAVGVVIGMALGIYLILRKVGANG
jgi:F0F1-type ATP synthase assembly protein I